MEFRESDTVAEMSLYTENYFYVALLYLQTTLEITIIANCTTVINSSNGIKK
jgi:hypothetical protein